MIYQIISNKPWPTRLVGFYNAWLYFSFLEISLISFPLGMLLRYVSYNLIGILCSMIYGVIL